MKRFTSILLLCFLSTLVANAQYIDIQMGASLPAGSFSNSNLGKDEDGFAQNGFATGLSANYLIYQNLGICAKFSYNTFGFNSNELSTQTNKQAAQGTTTNVTADGKYQSSSALAGVYLSLGKQKLTLDLRLVGGFINLKSPQLLYTSTYQNTTYTSAIESFKDISPAIGFGFSLKYALPKDFYATLNLDNVNAKIQFPKNGYRSSNKDEVTKPYQAYAFTVGIGYKIQ
jgi:hypothetical protein